MNDHQGIRILIGADFVPTASNEQAVAGGDTKQLFGGELSKLWQSADYRVLNLEEPMTDEKEGIVKCGPHLKSTPETAGGAARLGVDLFVMANNHIMDYGEKGLESTVRALDKAGIAHIGTGRNEDDVKTSFIAEINGIRIGFYNCAEHEFSSAGEDSPGANAYDPVKADADIRTLKLAGCRKVIALYHGGKEYFRYPSPGLMKRCRLFVDAGADLVICQHSHCIGCEESYNGKKIIYGQGNFLFDKYDNEFWNTSLLVEARLEDGRLEVIPHVIIRNGAGLRLADDMEKAVVLNEYEKRGSEILEAGKTAGVYRAFAGENLAGMLRRIDILSGTRLFRAFNRLSGGRLEAWYFRYYVKKKGTYLLNTLECESWNELLTAALKDAVQKNKGK